MKAKEIRDRLRSLDFRECKKWEDVYEMIREELRHETWVTDSEDAEDYFEEMFGKDFDRDNVRHDDIWKETVNVDNRDYEVVVVEHYVDSGSVDYLYSCDIGERIW